ncbi:MAG: SIR2 family protein [Saprospiraceae bacterium]|nr:SIR2 family protein [Saprospiraceae bacterium]
MPTDSSASSGGTAALTDTVYQNIARNISEGSCVLFLGPAAITARQPDGTYRPLTELCANQLAKGLGLSKEEEDSLYHVASYLRVRAQRSDTMLISEVQDFYNKAEREAQLHPQLEQLADLPFRIVVNTTPDDFFARFYATAVRDYRFDFYNFRKPSSDPLYSFGDDAAPLIYNLFGFFKRSESLVLTYNDQLAYVNKITGAQHERLPDSLLAAFTMPRFYLFLGFDFEDWSLRVLLDALFKNARNSIQPFAYPLKGKREAGPYARVFFQSEFRMEFPKVDMETFIGNLLEHIGKLEGQASSDSATPLADALVLHNEASDDDGCQALLSHLKPLRMRTLTLRDAVGQGDVQAWIRKTLDSVQVVLPLVSADFFDASNPALPLLEEIVQRNDPRNRFLVMPILLKSCAMDATPLGRLRTTRPPKNEPVYGNGQENRHFADIADKLKTYIENLT